ncbi:MAG: acyl-CoA dehydrogenase family protein [Chloroflexi bacterium]|nr:acyl-CoA dehydrogenase family protein [Chloroflexota bacterium]
MSTPLLKDLQAVEAAREAPRAPSFVSSLFAGRPRLDLIWPFPAQSDEEKAIGDALCHKVEAFLRAHVDPAEIERNDRIPREVLAGLAELGCFGMNIPKEYGGLGLSQTNYNRVLTLVGSYCNVLALLLSAHQSIGVSKPILLFGTEQQKLEWLPKIAKGAVSAFALTEPQVGSDPASMTATATPSEDGSYYVVNGEKLWCTNGTIADVIVLMAKVNGAITAFIVDMHSPGVTQLHRCSFMGCHGIENGWVRFENVRVPAENVIGQVGNGLKIALTTLNTGRSSLAALCLGMAKQLYAPTVSWANQRMTFGQPIGRHELNTHKLARMAADVFAMEAVTWLVSGMIDRTHSDFRVESACAKLFCSERLWNIADTAMQIRGGRAYETADSLRARGEEPIPIEQLMRDARLYLIGEGASEILTLFVAREVWDPHLKRAQGFFSSNGPAKLYHAAGLACHYAGWYASQWRRADVSSLANGPTGDGASGAPSGVPARIGGPFEATLRYVEETSRRLARVILYAMARYGTSLERRQALVARLARIGIDLFVATAAALYASREGAEPGSASLAQQVVRDAQRSIDIAFRDIRWRANDEDTTALGLDVLRSAYAWLSEGSVPMPQTEGTATSR